MYMRHDRNTYQDYNFNSRSQCSRQALLTKVEIRIATLIVNCHVANIIT